MCVHTWVMWKPNELAVEVVHFSFAWSRIACDKGGSVKPFMKKPDPSWDVDFGMRTPGLLGNKVWHVASLAPTVTTSSFSEISILLLEPAAIGL